MQNQAELQIVPIGQVQESWSNPRKHFAKDTLAEARMMNGEKFGGPVYVCNST